MNTSLPQVTTVYVSAISEFLNDEKHRIIYLKEFKYNIVQVFGILNTEVKNPSTPPPPPKKGKKPNTKIMRREQVYTNVKISCISRLKYSSDQRRDNVPLEIIIMIMDDSENTSPKF